MTVYLTVAFWVKTVLAKHQLNVRIEAASALWRAGDFNAARAALEQLKNTPDIEHLGLLTSAQLPRRLQSAYMKLAKAEKDAIAVAGYRFHLTPPPELLQPFCKFSSIEKRSILKANEAPVPKVIHQIWIGNQPVPEGTTAWKRHASLRGYEYKLWTDSDLQSLAITENAGFQEMYDDGDYPGAVDVARYIILEKFGGIYLDCDWYPARDDISFHHLTPMRGICGMAEDIPRNTGKGGLLLANSLIMAPPSHPVFRRILDSLPSVMAALPQAPAWWSTGPLLFTLMCRGGPMTLADSDIVAGDLPQKTTLEEIKTWCRNSQSSDGGLLLSWKSWVF